MLSNLRNWKMYYAKPGYPDIRSMQDFIECETDETLKGLMAELNGIKNMNFSNESLRALLGQSRIARHKSYSEWAGLMLIAIAEYRR